VSCIAAAALRLTASNLILSVPRPGRHHHIINGSVPVVSRESILSAEQGFITDDGGFVDRYVGFQIAARAGQIVRYTGPIGMLFSEDMW